MKRSTIVQRDVKQTSKIVQEFSRFAHTYDNYNIIQKKVAQVLVSKLSSKKYKHVLDIGCGSGEVYKNFLMQGIEMERFSALDSSLDMLSLHPEHKQVNKICADFNSAHFVQKIPVQVYDLLISSSALQWCDDLASTLEQLRALSSSIHAAIFTSGTFKTLHQTAGICSPINDLEEIEAIWRDSYPNVKLEVHHYKLDFKSTRDMFTYIKKSGVSGGERKLTYKETKKLMKMYPLTYLEFEVVLIEASI